jgi:hypothetical protein
MRSDFMSARSLPLRMILEADNQLTAFYDFLTPSLAVHPLT